MGDFLPHECIIVGDFWLFRLLVKSHLVLNPQLDSGFLVGRLEWGGIGAEAFVTTEVVHEEYQHLGVWPYFPTRELAILHYGNAEG